ncbi:uncharacterized protein BDZ99DRAFT_479909 [Mytilinidion resinicola]|uniref:Uncharacterized protein n=1 Tax=Mytilinidion resinicola TaxID=574789 RepID=A0A6A6YCY9_9PEZI|nr:uncharacterized protein BDZ99DRAFT_479909 [Mytilinidion resinicola]KAF2805884.1 hypothetical protein BDZ99DRAFT_479909 [Mytilinidion resinicola]
MEAEQGQFVQTTYVKEEKAAAAAKLARARKALLRNPKVKQRARRHLVDLQAPPRAVGYWPKWTPVLPPIPSTAADLDFKDDGVVSSSGEQGHEYRGLGLAVLAAMIKMRGTMPGCEILIEILSGWTCERFNSCDISARDYRGLEDSKGSSERMGYRFRRLHKRQPGGRRTLNLLSLHAATVMEAPPAVPIRMSKHRTIVPSPLSNPPLLASDLPTPTPAPPPLMRGPKMGRVFLGINNLLESLPEDVARAVLSNFRHGVPTPLGILPDDINQQCKEVVEATQQLLLSLPLSRAMGIANDWFAQYGGDPDDEDESYESNDEDNDIPARPPTSFARRDSHQNSLQAPLSRGPSPAPRTHSALSALPTQHDVANGKTRPQPHFSPDRKHMSIRSGRKSVLTLSTTQNTSPKRKAPAHSRDERLPTRPRLAGSESAPRALTAAGRDQAPTRPHKPARRSLGAGSAGPASRSSARSSSALGDSSPPSEEEVRACQKLRATFAAVTTPENETEEAGQSGGSSGRTSGY